jgi:hypothetical protein
MLCELGSCERSECPGGMACVLTETPFPQGQALRTFTCQR